MGAEFAAERRLLAEAELAPVLQSHYPELEALSRDDVADLARWLRGQHGRARDIIRARRRMRRGKAEARGEVPSERGLAAKKQVFARALKRVNARLNQISAQKRRDDAVAAVRAALERKQNAPVHHPSAGRTAGRSKAATPNTKRRPIVLASTIGAISQAGRVSQATRDGRGG